MTIENLPGGEGDADYRELWNGIGTRERRPIILHGYPQMADSDVRLLDDLSNVACGGFGLARSDWPTPR